ncbi:MAG: M28 family peptidase [Planctomycetota bacterium]
MAPAFHACLSAIAAAALIVHDPLESSEPRAGGGAVPVAAASASSDISAENLQRTVRLLSADAFEGRKLGSAGSRAAARYMAAELEAVGLEPLGQAGTFLAPLTLVQRRFSAPPELRVQTSDGVWHQLEAGTEFGVFPTGTPPTLGEVAVRTAGTEEEVRAAAASDVALALTGSQGRARRWLDDPALADRRPPIVLVPGGDRRGTPIVPGPFGPATKEPQPGGEVRLTLSGPLAERLAAGEVVAVDFVPHLSFVPVDDVNLVGVLRGVGTAERPELAQEAIVVSAHRDHIGIQAIGRAGATEADVIANGADDDASGCAVALELARCLTAGPRPARSVVFLLVTGEEAGLLGSGDYVDAPAWPIERTVANLNLEMLGMPDPLTTGADGVSQPWLTGFERSTLGEALVALGLPVVADPRPKMNFFARSDNVSFARLGVVAHTLSTGGENPNYHQVRDEWHTLDYAHMARCAEVGLVALRALASGELTPTWRDGEPRLGR